MKIHCHFHYSLLSMLFSSTTWKVTTILLPIYAWDLWCCLHKTKREKKTFFSQKIKETKSEREMRKKRNETRIRRRLFFMPRCFNDWYNSARGSMKGKDEEKGKQTFLIRSQRGSKHYHWRLTLQSFSPRRTKRAILCVLFFYFLKSYKNIMSNLSGYFFFFLFDDKMESYLIYFGSKTVTVYRYQLITRHKRERL